MVKLNVDARGRQNVGRVSHVSVSYRSEAARAAAQKRLGEVLGISDWDDSGAVDYANLHMVIARSAGLELLSPLNNQFYHAERLKTYGEGFSCLIFGVADLDQAMARAQELGRDVWELPEADGVTMARFEVAREAVVGMAGPILVCLGEFKPRPGRELMEIDESGRQFVGGIDHLVFALRDQRSLAETQDQLAVLLGIEDWEDLGDDPEAGVHEVFSRSSGLKLVHPIRAGSIVDGELASRGEGLFAAAIGVSDLDEAVARAEKSGARAAPISTDPRLGERFEVARQAMLGDVARIGILLSELKPRTFALTAPLVA